MRARLVALVGVALGALASCGGTPAPVPATECLPDPDCDQLMVVAHRGYHATRPESSLGDIPAVNGDYRGWISYVDAGVTLLQTDYPQLLVPAVDEHHRTGAFPAQGPGVFQ